MTALLEVRDLVREFVNGDEVTTVLRGVDLRIAAGEMVAIMGPSGSGKSTLMHILGCLDVPSSGSYQIAGVETSQMAPDALARLRRDHFGFIFQRYQLLSSLGAQDNVAMPSMYKGVPVPVRHARARQLLERLGLGARLQYRPGQLSGGQQQRVSIARALMNGGDVILADEPTGALDQASGREVMRILAQLHAEGHTVILVTHDAAVADHAERIIEISDGRILADRRKSVVPSTRHQLAKPEHVPQVSGGLGAFTAPIGEAIGMAWRAMRSNFLRTMLTMLGIVIGIASVVSVLALGEGSRQSILADISAIGTNTIDIMPGSGYGDRHAAAIRTLRPGDGVALAQLAYVDSVTPSVTVTAGLRYRNMDVAASITGVGAQFFQVRGYGLQQGKAFDEQAVRHQAQEAVIDDNTRQRLFPNGESALGQVILLGKVPMRILGVTEKKASAFSSDNSLNIWIPYTTAQSRILGTDQLTSLTVRVSDTVASTIAEQDMSELLIQRHGAQDFFMTSSDSVRQAVEQTTRTITLLISAVAFISLLVGGIGVMNIMLVSVTERTQEIGVRMAVGARQSDIQRQFLIEAVMVCLIGGLLGIGLSLAAGAAVSHLSGGFRMVFSSTAILGAFGVSTLIGVLFGFLPARRAAKLLPTVALARS